MSAAKGDELEASALLVTNEAFRHVKTYTPLSQSRDMGHPFICGWSAVATRLVKMPPDRLCRLPRNHGGQRFRRCLLHIAQASEVRQ
jgi:hypothetical protein